MKLTAARGLGELALLCGLWWSCLAWAHTDLQVQIDAVSKQLATDPANTALLLRRGNLYRAHQDWQAAREDYQHVREIDPANSDVDWLAGRMEVEAGQVQTGLAQEPTKENCKAAAQEKLQTQ